MSAIVDITIKGGSKLHCGHCWAFLGLVNTTGDGMAHFSLIDGYHRPDRSKLAYEPTRWAKERYAKLQWKAERGDKAAARQIKTGRFIPADHSTATKEVHRVTAVQTVHNGHVVFLTGFIAPPIYFDVRADSPACVRCIRCGSINSLTRCIMPA